MPLQEFYALDDLPDTARKLFDDSSDDPLFSSLPWYRSFLASALPDHTHPALLVLFDEAKVARGLLPCVRISEGGNRAPGGASAASLTSFYSCDFRPVISNRGDRNLFAEELGRATAGWLSTEAVVRFDSLDISAPCIGAFLKGLSQPGRAMLQYDHFGRWWEPVSGITYQAYLARRDGALRETIRRKTARLERAGARFVMLSPASADSRDIERGIADYETVYAASWKESEPFPEFQPTLMRNLAAAGWLRLALIRIDEVPIAAQLWVIVNGKATVLKLAHQTVYDSFSPGTTLTSFAIRTLMSEGGIDTLDFGRGDDPYKKAWTTHRTPHIGVLWTSIARRPGTIARHVAGSALRCLRRHNA